MKKETRPKQAVKAKPVKKILRPKSAKPKAKAKKAEAQSFGLHNLKAPKGAARKKKLLGRGPGSGHGKTSTRGSKGQTSRSGRDMYLGFEGGQTPLIRRIPKRGFTSITGKNYQIVNLSDLNRIKEATINPEVLEAQGLIKDSSKPVKILGDGELKNAVTILAHAFSKSAATKIQKAGGKLEAITSK